MGRILVAVKTANFRTETPWGGYASLWRWRRHGRPKYWYPPTSLHDVTTQTTTWNYGRASKRILTANCLSVS